MVVEVVDVPVLAGPELNLVRGAVDVVGEVVELLPDLLARVEVVGDVGLIFGPGTFDGTDAVFVLETLIGVGTPFVVVDLVGLSAGGAVFEVSFAVVVVVTDVVVVLPCSAIPSLELLAFVPPPTASFLAPSNTSPIFSFTFPLLSFPGSPLCFSTLELLPASFSGWADFPFVTGCLTSSGRDTPIEELRRGGTGRD